MTFNITLCLSVIISSTLAHYYWNYQLYTDNNINTNNIINDNINNNKTMRDTVDGDFQSAFNISPNSNSESNLPLNKTHNKTNSFTSRKPMIAELEDEGDLAGNCCEN